MGFPGGSTVKNLPALQETRVGSLNREDPLEKEMASHSSILVWRIPWTEEPGYSPWGRKESDTTERLSNTHNNIFHYRLLKDNRVWLRKLKQELCINLEGWDGEGDGREVQKGGDICIPIADSC